MMGSVTFVQISLLLCSSILLVFGATTPTNTPDVQVEPELMLPLDNPNSPLATVQPPFLNQSSPDDDLPMIPMNPDIPMTNMTMILNMDKNVTGPNSCKDLCDTGGYKKQWSCQCNKKCRDHGDCCADYQEECLSCDQRCHFTFDRNFPCQCNSKCRKFNNCCQDYSNVCKWTGNITINNMDMNKPQNEQEQPPTQSQSQPDIPTDPAPVSDAELAALTEQLYALEGQNNAASLVRFNAQNRTTFGSDVDKSSLPLLTVNPKAYQKPTIEKILALHNNYEPSVTAAEVLTTQESAEETAFLDAILSTPVLRRAEQFLVDKGFIVNQRRVNGRVLVNQRAFRNALYQIWFNFYSRENRVMGSSGFEHVFLGETKAGQVSGFHNWIFFAKEEAKNNVNYYGHIRILNLGPKAAIIKHNFSWIRNKKPISTMFIGTSPELEMALYTVCYYARPGAKCPVVFYGKHFNVQTHYLNRGGKKYVASAYPDI